MKINFAFGMLLVTLFATAFLFSCNVEKRWYDSAMKLYARHPDTLAAICARTYPVEDSVVYEKIDSVKKGRNEDYSGAVDSLSRMADSLIVRLRGDSSLAAGVSEECAKIVTGYKKQVSELTFQLADLKRRYKPCDPDTAYKSSLIYRKNTAEIADLGYKLQQANHKIEECLKKIDEQESEANKKEAKIVNLQKDKLILISILCGLAMLSILVLYVKGKFSWLVNIFKR